MSKASAQTVIEHSVNPFSSDPRPPAAAVTMTDSEIEEELAGLFDTRLYTPAELQTQRAQRSNEMRDVRGRPPRPDAQVPSPQEARAATPQAGEVGGTIKLMRGVLAQKRDIQVSHRTGMPAHLDVTSNAAAMAMDILALSKETEYLNDESLRGGIWNFVVPSLLQQRECEASKFFQIVHYLMLKDSALMMRGLDFMLFLLGFYRSWESRNKKMLQLYNFQWTKAQKQRMFPNLVATVFEAERCEALVVAARGFLKEQALIHLRVQALYAAFRKLYTASGRYAVPHFRINNRKLVKQCFKVNMLYWDRQQRYLRKRANCD